MIFKKELKLNNRKCCIHLKNNFKEQAQKGFDENTNNPIIYEYDPETEIGYRKYFSGNKNEYHLICTQCSTDLDNIASKLIDIDEVIFNEIDTDIHNCYGFIGSPMMLKKQTDLYFEHKYLEFSKEIRAEIVAIKATIRNSQNFILAATKNREIWEIDYINDIYKKVYEVSLEEEINFNKEILLEISKDGKIIAITNSKGQFGVVVNIEESKLLMRLDRGNYHVEYSIFPVKFFEYNNQQLLIHGTDWNRLDISNPNTNEVLTTRKIEKTIMGTTILNYFHSDISISDNAEFVIDNGWVWHPVGEITIWSLQKWLKENSFESETGESLKSICRRYYFWEGSICWIDDRTVGVYGFGDDDDWIIPAIRVFDIIDLKELYWFPGPDKKFVFDKYLFSTSHENGTKIWDIKTGEMLLSENNMNYDEYDKNSKRFFSLIGKNALQISTLIDSNTYPKN